MATVNIVRQAWDFISDDSYIDIVADVDEGTVVIGQDQGVAALNPDDLDQFADTLKDVAEWLREQITEREDN